MSRGVLQEPPSPALDSHRLHSIAIDVIIPHIMKLPSIRLSRFWPFLVLCAVGILLFWPVRGYYVALPAPDSAPFFPAAHRLRLVEQFLAGKLPLSPHHLFSLLLPPLIHHDLIYLIDTLLIAAGLAYLLRRRGMSSVPAWFGGGMLAFAGYSFTLISAGHVGFFHMTVYVTFMFGFLVRALRGDGWPYFALTGLFGAWAILFGPDFGFVFLLLAAVYALWILLRNAGRQSWNARLRPLAVGVPVAALCFLLGSWSTLRVIFTEHLQHREQQIAASAPRTAGKDAPAEEAADDPQARWIFATNWSLHPEEIVEFVAPCLFGTQSGDLQAPYWGKLGRTLGWEEHRQGFANFRQHTIYLGGLQLLLAAFAVGCWLKARGQETGDRGQESGLGVECSLDSARSPWLTDVPFWVGVWVVGLLLAFGRHAPVYRLFYSLPYMSLLRAPVKFIRLVEFATAILAASGLACLLRPGTRRLRGWTIGAGICAGLLLLAAIWAGGADTAIRQVIEPMGLAPAADLLKGNLVRALLHGAAACGVAAALFFLRGRLRDSLLPLLVLAAAWLALDALLVNRRFITAADITPYYQLNRVSRAVLADKTFGVTIADYAALGHERDWYNKSLWTRQIGNCVRPAHNSHDPYVSLMLALERDPPRFWRLAGASYAVVPYGFARTLPREIGVVVDVFTVLPGYLADARSEKDAVALVKLASTSPYAWLSSDWVDVADEQHLETLLNQSDPFAIPVVSGEAEHRPDHPDPAGNVTVRSERFQDGARQTMVDVTTSATQLLTVRTRFEADLEACIDGRVVPLLKSNHLWCGVVVPAGSHTVTIATARKPGQAGMGALPLVAALALLAIVELRPAKDRAA